ncbi:FAD-binding oxidoreductase [Halioxenophilus aromaticivorans]|uniref:FAD-binding oxidoreductase n=1 Tax=Halioxenophilus aromaticivorans TaxID=1306992 RepID=A0AAV3TXS9_9ALTE
MVNGEFLSQLAAVVDDKTMVAGADIGAAHSVDTSGEYPCLPELLLRPGSTEELSAIIKLCGTHQQPYVVQGGMTGVSGGATPNPGEVAISLMRLRGIEEIDENAFTVTARAGTPLEEIQQAVAVKGLSFPLDIGARGSCTVGGIAATNAGGNQVIRYGVARNLILGLEVVLADGTVLTSLTKVLKNNTGYDLKQLFIGSEGTLGVITRVVLRLVPQCETFTTFCAVNSFSDVLQLFRLSNQYFSGAVSAFEVMWQDYMAAVLAAGEDLTSPFAEQYPFYVLLEIDVERPDGAMEWFENGLAQALEQELIQDAVIAKTDSEREKLWRIREGIGEVVAQMGLAVHCDVAVDASGLEAYVTEVERNIGEQFPDNQLLVFGHLGDGNLHITVSANSEAEKTALYNIIFSSAARHGGMISGEHGLGSLKRDYLSYTRTEAEVQWMRKLKQLFDPNNCLNPHRVLG